MSASDIDPASAEREILAAWHENAGMWSKAVRGRQIESRRLVTDRAVLEAVLECAPRRVLDVGCGEGWLAHALLDRGINVIGIDAVPGLVVAAAAGGRGDFRVMSYDQLAAGELHERFDAIVANFSLLGGDSVYAVLRRIPDLLLPQGRLILQTLHPWTACSEAPYREGWRVGSWTGCGEGFGRAAPWYFRTLEGWLRSLRAGGLQLVDLREPTHPSTGRPASLLLVADVAADARSDRFTAP